MPQENDDIIAEEETGASPVALAKLRERLKTCVAEKQEYLDGWQRARADFANYRKEEAALHAAKEDRIKAEFAEAMLPAIDAIWFAMKTPSFAETSAQWQAGLTTVSTELQKSLERFGFSYIIPEALRPTDAATCEIIREVPTNNDRKEHLVESVHRIGLRIGAHIIRPAQVSVFSYKKD